MERKARFSERIEGETKAYDVIFGNIYVHVVPHGNQEFSHAIEDVAECELAVRFEFKRGPFYFVYYPHLL